MAIKVSNIIKQALEQYGYLNLKDASKALGISLELLRITVNRGHIPKDSTLGRIADKLGLDRTALILAAHQEKVPVDAKGFFLSPVQRQPWRKKRVWPLSEEQCTYLAKILTPQEIQIIRKFRQVPDEAKTQIVGYVDYTWASKRVTMNAGTTEEKESAT